MKARWIGSVVLGLTFSGVASAVNFSIGPPSVPPSGTPAPLDDLLLPGPGPNYIGGSPFDVNGFSYGHAAGTTFTGFAFSVTAGSVGAPGSAVFAESGGGVAPGEQSAGIYSTTFGVGNGHLHDGDGFVFGVPDVGPPLGLIETGGAPAVGFDDVDGLDLRTPGAPPGPPPLGMSIYWTPSLATSGPGAADSIMVSAAGPGFAGAGALWAGPGLLGLGAFGPGDDIDALVVFEDGIAGPSPGDFVMFSLAAGSPSLAGLGFAPGGGEVLGVAPGGPIGLVGGFPALGLVPGDDLNALDIVVPEPSTTLLLMGGLLMLFRSRRRRT